MNVATVNRLAPSRFDYALLARFLRDSPFQPATALFRTVEVEDIVASPFPTGYGLDLGCGDGLLTRILLEQVGPRRVVGVDPDHRETDLAGRLGIYERVLTVGGAAIPVPDATFDWVFSNSVLEHVDGIDEVLREVARLLKAGGVFLFTVPGEGFHECLRGPVLPWVSRGEYLRTFDARVAHRRYWSLAVWRQHLATVGLTVTGASPYFGRRALRRWETIARLTAGVLYAAYRHRRQPIEIQRRLGLRRAGLRLPAFLANVASRLLAPGLSRTALAGEPTACLRILARKVAP